LRAYCCIRKAFQHSWRHHSGHSRCVCAVAMLYRMQLLHRDSRDMFVPADWAGSTGSSNCTDTASCGSCLQCMRCHLRLPRLCALVMVVCHLQTVCVPVTDSPVGCSAIGDRLPGQGGPPEHDEAR
jgi:hypothetical protein